MIGIFDSGVGGLTVVKEVFKKLPAYDVLYFADLARSPYGTKSKAAIENFSKEITEFLIRKGAKIIIVACNTASAQALELLKRKFNVPIFNVIEPAVEEAFNVTKNRKIGVIGTRGTIQSRAYEKRFERSAVDFQVFTKACPLFVPLAEEGFINRPETKKIVRYYLRDFKDKKIDTLVLGCTHYPLLKKVIGDVVGERVKLIDSSRVVDTVISAIKKDQKLEEGLSKKNKHVYFASDIPNNFMGLAERFLDRKIPEPIISSF